SAARVRVGRASELRQRAGGECVVVSGGDRGGGLVELVAEYPAEVLYHVGGNQPLLHATGDERAHGVLEIERPWRPSWALAVPGPDQRWCGFTLVQVEGVPSRVIQYRPTNAFRNASHGLLGQRSL